MTATTPATEGLEPLDEAALRLAAVELAAVDPDLGGILARHGPPPLWAREPGFGTLVAIILEQQVSLSSGAAALDRLVRAAGSLEPANIALLGEEQARGAGLTRQKARYVVGLAERIVDGRLDPATLATATDDDVRSTLIAVPGIGRWTTDIYLLMALGRPDVWPDGDLALAVAMRRAKRLDALPDAATQRRLAEGWRPWRAVAARLLWHAYLAGER
ncbi:MAG TPA: DNA-3-methyladenine glycosylase 2 family protein [Verrucomicrobiae bacterium]|nr:DNA-3-methyladenine glycosylase 2 family protein [Verrucomicrobiae bacterium]